VGFDFRRDRAMSKARAPVIGLALGGGAARGWSHIGVILALREAGIEPAVVAGTSIGALVGAAHVAGRLDDLKTWVESLTWQNVVGLLDVTVNGGLIKGEKLLKFFRAHFEDIPIERLPMPFGAVATDLASGRETWLRTGSVIEAVRASIALPGLFTPVLRDGVLLVDGGLVNPVPVSLCRALGADIVIAVDLNTDLVGRRLRKRPARAAHAKSDREPDTMLGRLQAGIGAWRNGLWPGSDLPSMVNVITSSLNIMQVRITRSRLAGEPADVMITPRLADMALMDFHRAIPAIEEGRDAAKLALPELKRLLHPE
jgi:NTE family protein